MFREVEEAPRGAGDDAREGSAEAGAVAARLLDGLLKLGIANVGLFALDDDVVVFAFVIAIDDEVGAVVRRPAGNEDFDADALGPVFLFVDERCPKLGADFFLRVAEPLGVVRGDVVNFLGLAFAGEAGVSVGDGALEVGHALLVANA